LMSLVPPGNARTARLSTGTAAAYLPCWINPYPWSLSCAPVPAPVAVSPDGIADACGAVVVVLDDGVVVDWELGAAEAAGVAVAELRAAAPRL
jgi:hypothetical protein